jgi:hypothetical protein
MTAHCNLTGVACNLESEYRRGGRKHWYSRAAISGAHQPACRHLACKRLQIRNVGTELTSCSDINSYHLYRREPLIFGHHGHHGDGIRNGRNSQTPARMAFTSAQVNFLFSNSALAVASIPFRSCCTRTIACSVARDSSVVVNPNSAAISRIFRRSSCAQSLICHSGCSGWNVRCDSIPAYAAMRCFAANSRNDSPASTVHEGWTLPVPSSPIST